MSGLSGTPARQRGVFLLWSRRDIPPFYLGPARKNFAERHPGVPLVAVVDDILPAFLRGHDREPEPKIARYRAECQATGYAGMVRASELGLSLDDVFAITNDLSLRDLKQVLPPYKTSVLGVLPMQEVGVMLVQFAIMARSVAALSATHAVCGTAWIPFMQTLVRYCAPELDLVTHDHTPEDEPSRRDAGFLVGGRETQYGA